MKKFLLFVVATMSAALLSVPMAFAAPSPTEPDRPPVEIEDPDVPLVEDPSDDLVDIEDPDVPLADLPVDIEDPDVPLADAPVDIEEPDVPLADMPVDIEDSDVPLSEELVDIEDSDVPFVSAPQTGVTGLSGTEALALAALAFAGSGAAVLTVAGKQKGSVC